MSNGAAHSLLGKSKFGQGARHRLGAKRDTPMRIENLQKTEGRASDKGFINMATFTLVLNDQVKLNGVKLIKTPDDNVLIYPPDTASGAKAWYIAPELREEVVRLAEEEMDAAMLRKFSKLVSL